MSEYAAALNEERLKAAQFIKGKVTEAATAKRSLTDEENAQIDKASADYDRLKAEGERVNGMLAKLDEGDQPETRRAITNAVARTEAAKSGPDDELLAAVNSFMKRNRLNGSMPAPVELDMPIDMAKVSEFQSRAISDFANNATLYINDFRTTVALFQRTASPLIGVATVITADNGRPMVIPSMTADPTVVSPGESTAISENSGTQGSATATPVGYKTLSYISNEVEQDELIGVLQLLAKTQGRALGIFGGTAMSASLLTAATNGGTATGLGGALTAAFVGYEDLLDLKYGRALPYRTAPGTGWLASNGMVKKMRKWTDKNGQYLWQRAIMLGQPDTFDGDAVYEDPGLAAPASATKSIVYGDLSAWIIKQNPLRVAVSNDYLFNTDQIAIRTVWRVAGALADTTALAYLVSANT